MGIDKQQESKTLKTPAIVLFAVLFVVLMIAGIAGMGRHHGRHKQHTKLVKTKSHHVYVENDGGSCFEFVGSGDGGADVELPKAGSSSFRLPSGSWLKTTPPKEEEIAEEEEADVEESDAGQPEADASGDVGADSDGSGSGDSGGGDSGGGDGGGDGGSSD